MRAERQRVNGEAGALSLHIKLQLEQHLEIFWSLVTSEFEEDSKRKRKQQLPSLVLRVSSMSIKYETIDGPMAVKMDKMFGVRGSFLRVQPGNCVLPPQYVLLGKRIKDMEIRDDDVWMVSFPRTGEFISRAKANLFVLILLY